MRGIAKWQVLKATTTNPLIRDFRHLLPCPHRWFKIQDWANPRVQAVRPRDRIKYWNIAPGDSIVDRLDPSKTVEQVLAVNRFSNRVYLKGVCIAFLLLGIVTHQTNTGAGKWQWSRYYPAEIQKTTLLSMPTLSREREVCATRRFVGRERVSPLFIFFPLDISFHRSVYAIRMKTTNVRYDSKRKRFRWDRIPVVYPQLSNSSKLAMKLAKAGVPWPTGKKRQSVERAYTVFQ